MGRPAETVGRALDRFATRLAACGVETPVVDAELLLAHVLGLDRACLRLDARRALTPDELAAAEALVARRAVREPLQHVLGEWGFRRLVLRVDARALVPRPETEVVVDRCLRLLDGLAAPRVLDVGTGGGAIALAIADEHPGARVTAIDVSEDALALAAENVARTRLPVEIRRDDLFGGLPAGPWDLVVSNPPYVEPAERDGLAPEVRAWEPDVALYATGETESIVAGALDVLAPGGALVLETHAGRAGDVAALLERTGYGDVAVTRDLAGRDRVVEGRAPGGGP